MLLFQPLFSKQLEQPSRGAAEYVDIFKHKPKTHLFSLAFMLCFIILWVLCRLILLSVIITILFHLVLLTFTVYNYYLFNFILFYFILLTFPRFVPKLLAIT